MIKTRVIINADDFGCSQARNLGILAACTTGVVTETSLLANGAAFAQAAALARARAIPVGVHLNLSEGVPLSGPLAGLTDAEGRLPGKTGLRRVLAAGGGHSEELRRELGAQIRRVLEAGLTPSHLDTHQHFFLIPAMTTLVIELAREFAIPALRLPAPMEDAAADPGAALGEELALYRRLAPGARAAIAAAGLAAPDGLWGMPDLNRLDAKSLLSLLGQLPPGTWELMVHPGNHDPLDPFGGVERERERDALTCAEVKALLGEREIELITFGDLTCVS